MNPKCKSCVVNVLTFSNLWGENFSRNMLFLLKALLSWWTIPRHFFDTQHMLKATKKQYRQVSNIRRTQSQHLKDSRVPSCGCFCRIPWSQMLSREWRCSWSSADRRCSNYIWVINNFIAYKGASYIRDFTVFTFHSINDTFRRKKHPQLMPWWILHLQVYTKFSDRLSEETFPWLIQKFPCILIFKTWQPGCQLNLPEGQIRLDLTSGRPLV